MRNKRKIRRRCGCKDCGLITKPGNKYINGHNWKNKKRSEETILKMSLAQQNRSEETQLKISLANKGKKQSKETILKRSLANIKYNPNYQYCDIWKDGEYKRDIRKDYCENANCKDKSKRFVNHHIHLDKKRCAPKDVITLCRSCHVWLHRMLEPNSRKPANPKDYIIINRPDHVSYIHKATRKIIRIERILCNF